MALKAGATLKAASSSETIVVDSMLGSGGQGEVYKVKMGNTDYALKWYNPNFTNQDQKNIIKKLIEKLRANNKLANDKCFVWQLDMVEDQQSDRFGYIMQLLDKKKYPSVNYFMAGKLNIDSQTLIRMAFNLVEAFAVLHTSGLVYADISFGNIHLDIENQSVKILDNDNVVVIGEGIGINGTADFKAPELITGKQIHPDAETDRYSLAVFLFYLFFRSHPLWGKNEADIKIFDLAAQRKIYGTEAIFIYDPHNAQNRPVPGEHDNAIHFWKVFPDFFKDVFVRAFTDGLHNKNKRIAESEWKRVFCRLGDSIASCNHCRADNFYDIEKLKAGQTLRCWHCKNEVILPFRIRINKNVISLNKGTKLYPHHIETGKTFDFSKVMAEVVENPKKPGMYGLKNLTENKWIVTDKNGTVNEVVPGKSAVLKNNAEIDFITGKGKLKK